ncbi:MAG: HAD family phosphatase [Erysipelotrichaceae bacterium]|nr:HAD family phosphatase [Erysipelotrichaceae bacterium]
MTAEIKMIIFDYDGVIVQTEKYRIRALAKKLNEAGIAYSKHDLSELMGGDRAMQETVFDYLYSDQPNYWKYREQLINADHERPELKEIKTEGLDEVLDELNEAGVICCVVANTPEERIRSGLEELEIADRFQYVVSGMDSGHHKPDSYIFHQAMDRFGIRPEECIIIDDSAIGINAALKTSAKVYALKDEDGIADQSRAHRIIASLKELMEEIR